VKAVYSQYDSNGIVCLDKENTADEQRKGLPPIPGMQRFLSGHLLSGSRSMGFIAAINPENMDMNQAAPLLAILTRFVAIVLRNRDMLNNLEKESDTDSLTRYGNRRAFHEYLHRIPQDTPVVLIFGDMNGLKRINDEQGHEAGDQVLCLSARLLAARAGKDAVFRMGGDEFIEKPFDLNVVTAKVQAVLRRTYEFRGTADVMEWNGAILNLADATVLYQDQKLELSKNEFKILQILLENTGKIVSRESIMTRLWDSNEFIDDNTLTVNVARLRKKMEQIGLGGKIITKKGIGYMVEA